MKLKRKSFFGIALTLLLVSISILTFNIQPVRASGTIHIRSDGSVEPDPAPVSSVDNITYTFDDNIYDSIVVERDNIVVDGAGYTLQGSGSGTGMDLSERSNVTIKNMDITCFDYGIWLYWSSNNVISRNNFTNNSLGIMLLSSSNCNSILGNNLTDNFNGVQLAWSSDNVLRNNIIDGGHFASFAVAGSTLSEFVHDVDASNTVDDKTIYYWVDRQSMEVPSDAGYVGVINSNNITVTGLELKNNGQGILLANTTNSQVISNNLTNNRQGIVLFESSDNSVCRNNMTNSSQGIWLHSSSNNTISRNNMANSEYHGLLASSSSDNTISGNNMANNEDGINLGSSSSNTIHGNSITNNSLGIMLSSSSNNSIFGNNITDNEDGLRLIGDNNLVSGNNVTANRMHGMYLCGSNNRLRKNILNGNNYNFGVGGSKLLDFMNDVDVSNVVDGKPVYYYVNSHNEDIPSNVGFVGLVNCTGITVRDATLKHNWEGMLLVNTSNTLMQNLNISNNFYGIYLEGSSNNYIKRSTICNNQHVGMWVRWSTNNIVSGNSLENNSNFAVMLSGSSQNTIFHNSFINNGVWSFLSINVWDNGYPSGGNYWSDYTDVDEKNGLGQDLPGSDGIWDHPYEIDANNNDNYPLVEPWTPLPRTIGELRTKIEEFGSEGEVDNRGIAKSLIAKLNVAQKLVDKGKIDEAKSILENDFIPQVQNLSGIHMTVEAADILIQSAEYIISHL
ncbi:MAG: right-handed parallel beta-helix repeat-containing protein [Candidatus Bathyarchaeota archaeon]|nr:right-handed parallel beta-helix repeat-containing protein [Candidatus Bathyarchaeota archaeon]